MNDDIITKLRHLSGTKVKVSEFVELKRVFVVCLWLQFQESLGGVFNEGFASLDAAVRESGFEATVDGVSVCPPVVRRAPQIDVAITWCAPDNGQDG